MKLCFLASANSIHSFRWIKYFADKGHEIHWISLQKNEFGDLKNVKFYLLKQYPTKFLDIIFNAIPIQKLIKEIKPDILHAHYAGVNGILGALSRFHPFVLTAWGSDILIAGKNFLTKPLIKSVLKKTDLITCDAEHMKEAMIKLGAKPKKIKIIYFGVDTEKFSPGSKDKELIKKLGIENCPVVISLRNLEPIYDVETLIRAIPLVLKEIPSVKFIIAGKGSEEEKLRNLAKELKVSESVRFVGFIPNDELPKYLRTADVYVSTSLSDAGISASTAEAMACGLPVIITKTGENEKWIEDGENGFLIPVKNSEILAEKIIFLLENKNVAQKIGIAARKTIEERNSYFREMSKMEKIYEEIIKNSNQL
jgi:glycosyltransferase involved in cell wall biosynthesis